MKKRHCLIIGGTRGIGQVLVKTLAEENYILSVIGRRPPQEGDRALPEVHHWIGELLNREFLSSSLTEIVKKMGSSLVWFFFNGIGNRETAGAESLKRR